MSEGPPCLSSHCLVSAEASWELDASRRSDWSSTTSAVMQVESQSSPTGFVNLGAVAAGRLHWCRHSVSFRLLPQAPAGSKPVNKQRLEQGLLKVSLDHAIVSFYIRPLCGRSRDKPNPEALFRCKCRRKVQAGFCFWSIAAESSGPCETARSGLGWAVAGRPGLSGSVADVGNYGLVSSMAAR